jgi:hypothetical protein
MRPYRQPGRTGLASLLLCSWLSACSCGAVDKPPISRPRIPAWPMPDANLGAYSEVSFQPRCFQRNNPVSPRRFTCNSWKRSYSAVVWLVDLR